jgi:hypothetical protein
MNWIDPEIANLQPFLLLVDDSRCCYCRELWSICTGYDFRICFFVVDTFTNRKTRTKMDLNIMEITYINELALTVGLILLTIGFLGGQWANESWGRYWGWDPKETWALISIMVMHLLFIPDLYLLCVENGCLT